MNSFGAMNSPVKQPLPAVLTPPTISNSSPSKVQQSPNLTPLNLNTTSQSAQPLSLVNEHKNVPIVIPPPVVTSVENIVPKSTACNGVPDAKQIGDKIDETLPKIESKVSHNQVNNSINVKVTNESPLSETKPRESGVENLSQKKDDKSNLPINQTDKVLPITIEPSIKPEELPKTENATAKPKENDTKTNPESSETQAVVSTSPGQTNSSEKNEQASSKAAVRRKREHKVCFLPLYF